MTDFRRKPNLGLTKQDACHGPAGPWKAWAGGRTSAMSERGHARAASRCRMRRGRRSCVRAQRRESAWRAVCTSQVMNTFITSGFRRRTAGAVGGLAAGVALIGALVAPIATAAEPAERAAAEPLAA